MPIAIAFYIVPVAGAAGPPKPTVNPDKLKPGDKLEVQVGVDWVAAEFIEKVSDRTIRVKRADFPVPVSANLVFVRLAKGGKAGKTTAGEPTDDNPFSTPDEKAAATTRTWSDQSGKFKVDAALVRVDAGNAVLRRDDGKEVSVPVARLSQADQLYLASLPRSGSSDTPAAPEKDEPPAAPKIDITPTDLLVARQVSISPDADWSYQTDSSSAVEGLPPAQLGLRPMGRIDLPVRILLAPSLKKAFVVSRELLSGGFNMFKVQACDLDHKRVESAGNFGVGVAPFAVAPDGAHVIARTEQGGLAGKAELQLYALEGDRVKPLAAWLPYRHHASSIAGNRSEQADPDRPELDIDANVTWAEFLDPTRLMTSSAGGEIAVWTLPKIEPVYYLPGDGVRGGWFFEPVLSPGKEYVALPTSKGVAILRTTDGQTAGVLPTSPTRSVGSGRLAWNDSGTKLAMLQPGRLRVWDLSTRELVRDFPVDAQEPMGHFDWVDDQHAIVNGHLLVDVDRRIALTTLGDGHYIADAQVLGGILWTLGSITAQQLTLAGAPAIPKDFKDPAGGKTADELLVIKPGMDVMVQLPPATTPDAKDAEAAVLKRLQENGMNVVATSKVRLVGTITPGQALTVQYRTFGSRQMTSQSLTEQIITLSYVIDNATVWKYEAHIGAPPHVQMNQGESLGDAISRLRKIDGSLFANVWIPAYIAQSPAAAVPPGVPGR